MKLVEWKRQKADHTAPFLHFNVEKQGVTINYKQYSMKTYKEGFTVKYSSFFEKNF